MIGQEVDIKSVSDALLESSPADQTEVIVVDRRLALTRFANSEIHQNVAESSVAVRVRVVQDQRVGVASTNQVGGAALEDVLARAIASAATQPPQPDHPPMPPPAKVNVPDPDPETTDASPELRAEQVGAICSEATRREVRAFGSLSTGCVNYAVANSNGLFLHSPRSLAALRVVTMTDEGTGFAERCSSRIGDIDGAAAGVEAIDKALRNQKAEAVEPGVYPVVLEAYAVAELLEYLSYIGFSGLAVEEGRSFMRPGEKITGDRISIWDDGNDPAGLPMPFDFEGVPRQRVDLITGGEATGLVHDLASAARAGVKSTGHGLPAPNPFGAWATNLFMAGGAASSGEELAQGIKRGIWVTRFWYVNVVHPRQSILTGMTRDGTFLIEDGKVTRPVKNMRFTQSVMDAFATCTELTKATQLEPGTDYDFVSGQRVPALRLDNFNFTSVTR